MAWELELQECPSPTQTQLLNQSLTGNKNSSDLARLSKELAGTVNVVATAVLVRDLAPRNGEGAKEQLQPQQQ